MSLGVRRNSPVNLSSVNTGRTVTGCAVNLDVDMVLKGISRKRRKLIDMEGGMLLKR